MGELAPAAEADSNTPIFGEQQHTIPCEPQAWASLIETLPLTAMTRQLALNCVVSQVDEHGVQLSLNQGHQHVMNDRHIDKLSQVLSSYTGKPVRVQVSLVADLEATPVQLENERQAQRQQAAETEIHNDPNVRAMLETFDAQIQNGSIRPQD
jgi:DNA polymerase-3 subunit gamma/tau